MRGVSMGLAMVMLATGFGVWMAAAPTARAVTFFLDPFDPAPLPGWAIPPPQEPETPT